MFFLALPQKGTTTSSREARKVKCWILQWKFIFKYHFKTKLDLASSIEGGKRRVTMINKCSPLLISPQGEKLSCTKSRIVPTQLSYSVNAVLTAVAVREDVSRSNRTKARKEKTSVLQETPDES